MRGLSLVAASGDHSSSRCTGPSLSRPLLLGSTGSRRAGSVIVAHGPSCSAACGILPDQGSNPCPLHWQADSQPLRHQGSPRFLTDARTSGNAVRLLNFAPSTGCLWGNGKTTGSCVNKDYCLGKHTRTHTHTHTNTHTHTPLEKQYHWTES